MLASRYRRGTMRDRVTVVNQKNERPWRIKEGRARLKNRLRIIAILGWITSVAAASGCVILFQSLQGALAREQRLRHSTAGLENRVDDPKTRNAPILLVTGDSRAAQLGEDPLGRFAVVNRGVPGQTTIEVLARIGRDMAVTRPDQVLVIAGVNDLKNGVESPEELTTLMRSFEEILLIGEAMDIPITLCRVWGASNKASLRGLALPPGLGDDVEETNRLLRELTADRGANIAEIDPILDEQGLAKESLSADALHLNAAGVGVLRKSLLDSLDSIHGERRGEGSD